MRLVPVWMGADGLIETVFHAIGLFLSPAHHGEVVPGIERILRRLSGAEGGGIGSAGSQFARRWRGWRQRQNDAGTPNRGGPSRKPQILVFLKVGGGRLNITLRERILGSSQRVIGGA